MKRILPILAGILVLTTFACKTSKNAIEVKDQVKPSDKTPQTVKMNEVSVEWFDGKFNGEINNNGKKNAIKGRVRIRKDSLIWISIKPDVAIIEVFRVLISPDSIQLVDYLNKKVFYDKVSAIKDFINYDVSFNMVQNIFIGNPTSLLDLSTFKTYTTREGQDLLSSSDFDAYKEARSSRQPANYLFQALWFLDGVHKRNLMYDPSGKMEMDLQYVQHEMVDSILLPKTGQLTIIGDSTNTRFTFDYTRITTREIFDFPFSIPESYERMYLKK